MVEGKKEMMEVLFDFIKQQGNKELTMPPRRLEAPAKVRRLNMAEATKGKTPPSILRPTNTISFQRKERYPVGYKKGRPTKTLSSQR
jgi:hypothetical protein